VPEYQSKNALDLLLELGRIDEWRFPDVWASVAVAIETITDNDMGINNSRADSESDEWEWRGGGIPGVAELEGN
jgi:hypothetical protein